MATRTQSPMSGPPLRETFLQNFVAALMPVEYLEEQSERDGNPDEDARNLHSFVKHAWYTVESTPFQDGWHIGAICEHLQAVSDGQIRNLLINLPPRHAKSTVVSVMWPAWRWVTRPAHKWFFASYAQPLSTRDSVRCRRVIQSRWYQRRWADSFQLTGDQNQKMRFENSMGGHRIASSVTGGATGEGGDTIGIDDPHNREEIDSEVKRLEVLDWWDRTMSTRLNDPNTGSNVIIMQRLHEDDLAGHILASDYAGEWDLLRLPAEWDGRRIWTSIGWTDPRTEDADLLWPERFTRPAIERLKVQLQSEASGQLQQNPTPPEGGIVKRHWWRFWEPEGVDLGPYFSKLADGSNHQHEIVKLPAVFDEHAQSWDLTFKDTKKSDYVAGGFWSLAGANAYLRDIFWNRADVQKTIDAINAMKDAHPETGMILVEDKANGPAVLTLLREKVPGMIPFDPGDQDKTRRLKAQIPWIQAGNVILPHPRLYEWVARYITQMSSFPNDRYDDVVDMTTQLLRRWFGVGGWGLID